MLSASYSNYKYIFGLIFYNDKNKHKLYEYNFLNKIFILSLVVKLKLWNKSVFAGYAPTLFLSSMWSIISKLIFIIYLLFLKSAIKKLCGLRENVSHLIGQNNVWFW